MIAVVTGSTGFIGSHLVDALLAQGHTVRAVYRPETPQSRRDSRVEQFEADLIDDRSVRQCGAWKGATHVFHLAGITKGRTLAQFRAGNVFPTANVLAALAGLKGSTPRVVLMSSQAASGPASSPDAPTRETDRPIPIEDYGRSKLQAEQAVQRHRGALRITILRPAAVYGPRDHDFLGAFRQASHRIAVHAVPRAHQFSIVHVDDVVRAMLLAGDVPQAVGQTYFVANDAPTTWQALYAVIAECAGVRPVELQLPLAALRLAGGAADLLGALTGRAGLLNGNKVQLARAPFWVCDTSHARDELGFTAKVSLQQGVLETYLWYLGQGLLRSQAASATDAPDTSTDPSGD